MRVEIHDAFKSTMSSEATRVVVYDEFDNPIAVVAKIDGQQYVAATAANPKFNEVLKALGINKTLIIDHINTRTLKPLPVD
jgi:Trk K+ transport system NAD-binding subunit